MRKNIVEFLSDLPELKQEQFNVAYKFYRESEGKNSGIERNLNVTGYTPGGLNNLLYDLQKLHNISDVEIANFRNSDLKKGKKVVEKPKKEVVLEAKKNDIIGEESEIPVVNESSLREEFSFLNNEDCPDELKILVADKITAWKKYNELHASLVQIESGDLEANADEIAEISKAAVLAFDENQKIYDELNVYATTGKILGVHPIFRKLQLTREVEAMSTDELIKYKSSSAKYFTDNKTALAKAKLAKDVEKQNIINNRVAERKEKLFFVNNKLGV